MQTIEGFQRIVCFVIQQGTLQVCQSLLCGKVVWTSADVMSYSVLIYNDSNGNEGRLSLSSERKINSREFL